MGADLQFDGGYTGESWEYARAFVGTIGPLPSTFTSVIRLLLADYDKQPQALTEYGRFFAGRLVKASAIQAPYFYAIRYFRPQLIKAGEPFTVRHFLDAFNGFEHGCMLGTILFYRLAYRVCDHEQLSQIARPLQRAMNLGWLIGNSLPAVGGGAGLLAGAIRYLGLIPFVKHDVEGFKEYQRYLAEHRLAADADYEYQRWQCNALQIALLICQQLGFGMNRIIPLLGAITTTSPLLQQDESERAYRAVNVWMESLSVNKSAPTIPLPPKFYPNAVELNVLLQAASTALNTGDAAWLDRTKSDLGPDKTPELALGSPDSGDEVPTELEEALPKETINELSSKLITDLLQGDSDQGG